MPPFPPRLAVDSRGVARRFGARWVLRGVSVEVEPGEIVGLLGANGTGKTTLLRILSTLLAPSAGSATVFGCDVVKSGEDVRRLVGFLPHAPGLYDDLTALENLRFAADMLGLGPAGLEAVLERVGLLRVAAERVRGFSAGMQRRLSLARLMLRRPRLLLLDEPYSNLDADGVTIMNGIIGDVRRDGGAALMALHELAPAASVLDRTLTIVEGRVINASAWLGIAAADQPAIAAVVTPAGSAVNQAAATAVPTPAGAAVGQPPTTPALPGLSGSTGDQPPETGVPARAGSAANQPATTPAGRR